MSTLSSKINTARIEAGATDFASPGLPRLPGPLETAALGAAQAHGMFVWFAVIAGLTGFRPEHLPAVTATWLASASVTGIAASMASVFAIAQMTASPPSRA